MSTPIYFPLLNPNEPEALLTNVYIKEGQKVSEDEPLCTLETTKSTSDMLAETDGYIAGLQCEPGQSVLAGELFCYLAESPDWSPPEAQPALTATKEGQDLPKDLRITQPALTLARQAELDLSLLPVGPLITVEMVKGYLEKSGDPGLVAPESHFDPSAIIIYGGGGHGKSLIDLVRALHTYRIVGIVDDGITTDQTVMDVPILGGAEKLAELYDQGVHLAVNAVGGIGNLSIRVKVFQLLAKAGFVCPAVVHPSALVEPSAELSPGVQVFPHAYVGSDVKVGFGAIVNTGAIVSHDCTLGDYANISPGAILAGGVQVGNGALIGMGATVNLMARIGTGARIGNGATVKEDVPEKSVVRAGSIWPT